MTAAVLRFGRTVLCGGCYLPFFDQWPGPVHCCPRCEEEGGEAMAEAAEFEAKAAGFATFDEWANAGYPDKRTGRAPE
jgi:hypothetical protein